jgi:hypothetical protein
VHPCKSCLHGINLDDWNRHLKNSMQMYICHKLGNFEKKYSIYQEYLSFATYYLHYDEKPVFITKNYLCHKKLIFTTKKSLCDKLGCVTNFRAEIGFLCIFIDVDACSCMNVIIHRNIYID